MASSALPAFPTQPVTMDRTELDAARALLGVSPSATASSTTTLDTSIVSSSEGEVESMESPPRSSQAAAVVLASVASHGGDTLVPKRESSQALENALPQRRPRSNSAGLDALAALATKETTSSSSDSPLAPFLVSSTNGVSSSDSDDSEAMPPPPPRRRRRSASNPEGMEKWDSLISARPKVTGRRHFVLPASILEEELAQVNAAMQERAAARSRLPQQQSIPEEEEYVDTMNNCRDLLDQEQNDCSASDEGKQQEDEASLSPDELLRRARSRVLEDLSSEGSVNGEKGAITLPHSLAKYKEVYNKNGRIGIYTPAERAAIIARFNQKRTRRVWNKKIRYNCRKSLADRRLRVKGRFVKRSEQEQLAKELLAKKEAKQAKEEEVEGKGKEAKTDEDMPDVNNPEAGFAPTEDQPYRRLRRHTIT